jgi:SAM-dependent methyltransferase
VRIYLIYIFFIPFVLIWGCDRRGKSHSGAVKIEVASDSVIIQSPGKRAKNKESFDFQIADIEDPDRGNWQNPTLVLNKLGALEGKVVADLGCGTGYFTFPIASKAQKVIAIDIQQQFLDYIEDRKLEASHDNADKIETRLTVEDDPSLAPEEVDDVLMVNVYYYLKTRPKYMEKVRNGLKMGGILILVDFKPGDLPVGPAEHKVSVKQVVSDLERAGFKVLDVDLSSLQYQYIIKAKR